MGKEDLTTNFITKIIEEDIQRDRAVKERIHTRFPPEPNGHLHIGHAKALLNSYNIAKHYSGKFNLRFDDTNPEKESPEFIESIKEDLTWLGVKWDNLCHTSDYFEKLHDYAVELIKKGRAYCCSLSVEENRKYRGDLKNDGKNSPYRDRSVEENLEIFKAMRDGVYKEGEMSLKAKTHMSHTNITMRDPVIYRVKYHTHPVTGDKWCIYPMYDFAHCLSDAIEGISHSLCSLEFMNNRELYNWFLYELKLENPPRQIEFSKLSFENTILGKRHLRRAVEEGLVLGWDDPRLLTLKGLKRRGVPANAIKNFVEDLSLSKKETTLDYELLNHHIREELRDTKKYMGVINPIKVTITNWDGDKVESRKMPYHPKIDLGERDIFMSKEIYIDRSDFEENPPKKYFRLKPEGKVRLKYGYVITCTKVNKDSDGNILSLEAEVDYRTLGGVTPEGEKRVKGIINWLSTTHSKEVTYRLIDNLCEGDDEDPIKNINPNSLKEVSGFIESSFNEEESFHLERCGWFIKDKDSTEDSLVLNRIIGLKSNWNKK